MLNFIGTGSAFNTKLGNNSAYMKSENCKRLLLIDCGSSIFERIIKAKLLDGVEEIQVLITHTHPDHVGSLGDLIFYSYYSMQPMFKPKVTVFFPDKEWMVNGLRFMGITTELYNIENDLGCTWSLWLDRYADICTQSFKTSHVKELECWSYLMNIQDQMTIYYSGDSNTINQNILDLLFQGKIDYFYQDTCKPDYEGNVHLSLSKLCEMVPVQYRLRVCIMHQDNTLDTDEAQRLGFNVV